MKAYIRGIGAYVPARRMSNDELAGLVETSDAWIYSHTGIHNRHIAEKDEITSDLAAKSGLAALADAGLAASELDMILLATTTPDHIGFPSTACLSQAKLGADKAAAMDLTAACSGFIFGLEMARALVGIGSARNVLVLGAEVLSRAIDWKDRNTCVLFGDGSGAAVVSLGEEGSGRGLIDSVLFSNGKDSDCLIRPAGGMRKPFAAGAVGFEETYIQMEGKKVYLFAVSALGQTIELLMQRNGLDAGLVDWIVPHQANVRIIEACAKRLGIPMEKFFVNIDEYANTSAASIPIALSDMKKRGLLKPGQRVITAGFGSGLTWGGNYLVW